jgi:hypothetical protein
MAVNLGAYKARTGRLDISGIDFEDFRDCPLGPETLRCLRYMHDVEFHTICYLRDLLVTSAHADPDITSFLSFWTYEEYWHGEALADVLSVHGEETGSRRVAALRRANHRRDRWRPFIHALGSMWAGSSYIAIHMSWGAVNEWTTQAGYGRLAVRARHPTLTELLTRIMRQEGRHIDFYARQARERLEADLRAQRLTRLALRRFWSPVGATVMPSSEVAFLVDYLFGGDEGGTVVRRLDRRIEALPGLGGLRLLGDAVASLATPALGSDGTRDARQLAT